MQTMYIYEITNNLNGKTYVGQRHCPVNKTPWTDTKYMGGGVNIYRAKNKYGVENFSKRIIAVCHNENILNILEKSYISIYKEIGKAEYNIASGGDGGNTYKYKTEEELLEIKKKLSNSLKGKSGPMKGKHLSEETKKKIKESVKFVFTRPEIKEKLRKRYHRPWTEEERKQISERNKGRKLSDETKEKISIKNKGNQSCKGLTCFTNGIINIKSKTCPDGFYKGRCGGKPLSEETKRKIRNSLKGHKLTKESIEKMKNTRINYKWWNNGKVQTLSEKCPDGFVPGRLKTGNCWNKGIPNSPEIRKKISEANRGRKWYNNGDISTMAFECPEGFVHGRLLINNKSTNGYRWYTNGIDDKLCKECPEGYRLGRIFKKKGIKIEYNSEGD